MNMGAFHLLTQKDSHYIAKICQTLSKSIKWNSVVIRNVTEAYFYCYINIISLQINKNYRQRKDFFSRW